MTYSNLSKIKPRLRTTGRITGNFGHNRVKANSPLNEIGMSTKENIKITTQEDYLNRLYVAFDETTDPKLKRFIYEEIRSIMIKQNRW
jgi:hypothetical protein